MHSQYIIYIYIIYYIYTYIIYILYYLYYIIIKKNIYPLVEDFQATFDDTNEGIPALVGSVKIQAPGIVNSIPKFYTIPQ